MGTEVLGHDLEELWRTAQEGSPPLTRELLDDAMAEMVRHDREVEVDRAERMAAFARSVPEHMRGTEIVGLMTQAFYEEPIHPARARQLHERYQRELEQGRS